MTPVEHRALRVAASVGGPRRCRLEGVGEHGGGVDGPSGPAGSAAETQATVLDPSRQAAAPIPDLIKRDYTATAVNQRWCGDLTEIPTDEAKLYLATVEDLASRRLPGFALGEHHDAALAKAALCMAAAVRGGDIAR
jgi:transposase InsO family protein